jgi:flagellar FliJ protein
MTYSFPYQKIVDLKSNQTSQAKWLFQSAMKLLKTEQEQLVEMIKEKEEIAERLSHLHETGSSVSELLIYQNYLFHIDSTINLQNNEVEKAESKVTTCRHDLTRYEAQEKVWHKLKEKRFRQYVVELNREEQKESDEISSYQHFRSLKQMD